MREAFMVVVMAAGVASLSRKTLSTTDNSVLVVSMPQKAHQSFTTMPAPTTSLPRFTVPATSGTWSREDSSPWSSIEVLGWTRPPWLLRAQ
uniref:Putative secreted protein n=1 Tax=Ixodes ricinus TaxID=34613 RepID=A0A6B0UGK6_IXORI